MEKHQYGFSFMNGNTGGCRTKSFWGNGATEEECKKSAWEHAKVYNESLTDAAYNKACNKAVRIGEYGMPSRESYKFQIVGCSKWQ